MSDDKAKELQELADEYAGTESEVPAVMGASCHGGGGATTGKSPGCSDLSNLQSDQ